MENSPNKRRFYISCMHDPHKGYVYHFSSHFKASVKAGFFGSTLQKETLYWKSFMTLGIYVKIFQYSVVLYDILVRCDVDAINGTSSENGFIIDEVLSKAGPSFWIGLGLCCMGQLLNAAVFYRYDLSQVLLLKKKKKKSHNENLPPPHFSFVRCHYNPFKSWRKGCLLWL